MLPCTTTQPVPSQAVSYTSLLWKSLLKPYSSLIMTTKSTLPAASRYTNIESFLRSVLLVWQTYFLAAIIARVCVGYTEKSARPIKDSNQNAIPPPLCIFNRYLLCAPRSNGKTFLLYLTNLIPAHRVGNICSPRVSEIFLQVLKQKKTVPLASHQVIVGWTTYVAAKIEEWLIKGMSAGRTGSDTEKLTKQIAYLCQETVAPCD